MKDGAAKRAFASSYNDREQKRLDIAQCGVGGLIRRPQQSAQTTRGHHELN